MTKIDNIKEVIKLASKNLKEQNYIKAQKYFEQAKDLDPKSWAIQNNLGIIYKKIGQYKKAIDIFRNIIDNNPNAPEPHNNLGSLYLTLNKFKKAISCFKESLNINPKSYNKIK